MMTEQLNPKLVPVESALASLLPAAIQLNREEMIYSAGARAAAYRARTTRRVWQGFTATAVLVSISLFVLTIVRSHPNVVERAEHPSARSFDLAQQTAPFPAAVAESTSSFSPIANVDGWNIEQLSKAGISVRPWQHDLQTEDPPLDWVQIAFDCSRLPENQEVLMTGWLFSDSGSSETATFRAERGNMDNDALTLLFTVRDDYRANSYVNILIWRHTADRGSEARGYKLSAKRIMELVTGKNSKVYSSP